MTTNVYDESLKMFCTDSRWSFDIRLAGGAHYAILYVDDTGFEKIESQPDYSFMFAGNSKLINEWKHWIRSPNKVVLPKPATADDFAVCMVETSTGKIVFEHGQKISGSDHRFAGTGAYDAYKCWNLHKNPKKCIESASKVDVYTGGNVIFLDMGKKTSNIPTEADLREINNLTLKKGMIMYIQTTLDKAITVKEASEKDSLIKNFVEKVANGSAQAEARSGLDKIVWTDADKERLDDALLACYGVPKR
jgi:hypothetical protein